jgi:hypothetical protein
MPYAEAGRFAEAAYRRALSLVEKNEGQASLDYAGLASIAVIPTQTVVSEEQIRLLRNARNERARGVRSKIGYRPRLPGSDFKESEALPGRRVSLIFGGAGIFLLKWVHS